MNTLGIEKRTGILYARIRPSLLKAFTKEAKALNLRRSNLIELMIAERANANKRNSKKPKRNSKAN